MVMVNDTGVVIKSWDNESLTSAEMELLEKEGLNLTAVAGAERDSDSRVIRYYCSVIAVVTMLLCCSDVA